MERNVLVKRPVADPSCQAPGGQLHQPVQDVSGTDCQRQGNELQTSGRQMGDKDDSQNPSTTMAIDARYGGSSRAMRFSMNWKNDLT
jgi:hypothetical protein